VKPPVLRVGPRDDDSVLDAAQAALERAGLILYPTDTLYALGGKALLQGVAAAVRRAKGRADDKPLPLIAADWRQVRLLSPALSPLAVRLGACFWPGPVTLVLPASTEVPPDITAGTGTVAVRIPALSLARRLCERVGPLIATSANRSGASAAMSCAEALRAVGRHVALAIDAGEAELPLASTVVDVCGSVPRLLRPGAIPWRAVLLALGEGDPR
jgi:L-threonylcarbamoyladenylate synthase